MRRIGDGNDACKSGSFALYADTRKRSDAEKWKSDEKVEIKNYFDNVTFEICETKEVSHGTKVMNCVFSYKVKTDSEGNETQCKVSQNESTYSETFTPTRRFTNIRTMCALSAQEDLRLYQFDVKCMVLRIQHLLGTSTSLNG